MTAAVFVAREGRPSVTGLQLSLERAREANVNLALELRTERRESATLAERVDLLARRLEPLSIAAGSREAEQWISELRYRAQHHLAQRSSGVL